MIIARFETAVWKLDVIWFMIDYSLCCTKDGLRSFLGFIKIAPVCKRSGAVAQRLFLGQIFTW